MHGRKHIHRVVALLTAVAAVASFTGSVQAADSPVGMSTAESRALMLRSEALNRQYGLDAATYVPAPAAMSWQQYRALGLRSEALNAKYGLGGTHAVASTPPAVTVAENGFALGDLAIGAAALLGLVLVATGARAATRRILRPRVSS
jgi:hypothetical protein